MCICVQKKNPPSFRKAGISDFKGFSVPGEVCQDLFEDHQGNESGRGPVELACQAVPFPSLLVQFIVLRGVARVIPFCDIP